MWRSLVAEVSPHGMTSGASHGLPRRSAVIHAASLSLGCATVSQWSPTWSSRKSGGVLNGVPVMDTTTYTYKYTYMHTYIHAYIHTYIYTYIQTYRQTGINTYIIHIYI
jgi:hypothetical protein